MSEHCFCGYRKFEFLSCNFQNLRDPSFPLTSPKRGIKCKRKAKRGDYKLLKFEEILGEGCWFGHSTCAFLGESISVMRSLEGGVVGDKMLPPLLEKPSTAKKKFTTLVEFTPAGAPLASA